MDWHSFSSGDREPQDLTQVVLRMLTERVTRSLPTSWRGPYTEERARRWIEERDREATTLLVVDRLSKAPLGLSILLETDSEEVAGGIEVRFGYLLAESGWGKGYARELIGGFVDWCRQQADIVSIVGGVERDHIALQRVLEKNGFLRVQQSVDMAAQGESLYRLRLRP